jgi:DNA-binding NarL/FixJ family response regulator
VAERGLRDDRDMVPRVLIVDDHAAFRSFAHRVLVADGLAVVGEAVDGAAAIEAAPRLRPDVVLLDVQLPDMDGFAVAEALVAQDDAPAVVLVSSRSRADYGALVDTCGAAGFIAKAALSGDQVRRLLADGA